jgi:hypothetical protein
MPADDGRDELPRDHAPKVRVYDSDGVFRGGLWRPIWRPDLRSWAAPPAPDYSESLVLEPPGLILRYFGARKSELSGSVERDSLFDSASYAVRCTAAEAIAWLERYGYIPPDDLRRCAATGCDLEEPRDPYVLRSPADTMKATRKVEWLAKAMLLVRDHPELSDAQIAKRVGKHRSTLTRSPEYQRAAETARGKKTDQPPGHIELDAKTGLTDVVSHAPMPGDLIPGSRFYRGRCPECGADTRVEAPSLAETIVCERCE